MGQPNRMGCGAAPEEGSGTFLETLVSIAVVIAAGCESCAESLVGRTLSQGTPESLIRRTLETVAYVRSTDCLARAVGSDVVARMERPLEAGARALRAVESAVRTGREGIRLTASLPEVAALSEERIPALQTIYDGYHDKVLAYASKLIGRDEADDVAQDVFIRVGHSLESLRDPSKLTSWIYSITLNAVRDLARRRAAAGQHLASRPSPESSDDREDEEVARIPDSLSRTAEEDAMRNQMVACYLDYVEALRANYYDVYVLADLEELTNDEIARRLSLTLGTVKIRLHRARAMIQQQLRRDCQCFYSDRGELMARPKAGVQLRRSGRRSRATP